MQDGRGEQSPSFVVNDNQSGVFGAHADESISTRSNHWVLGQGFDLPTIDGNGRAVGPLWNAQLQRELPWVRRADRKAELVVVGIGAFLPERKLAAVVLPPQCRRNIEIDINRMRFAKIGVDPVVSVKTETIILF